MSRYVEIRYSQFKSLMDEMGFKEIVVEGSFERAWSFGIEGTPYEIRVFSSISVNTDVTRKNGKDAIRCLIWNTKNNRIYLVSKRVHRTAAALFNTRERCRELYKYVKSNLCSCGGLMVERLSKTKHRFLGCSNFPVCKNTRNIKKKKDPQLKLALKWEE